MIRLLVCLAAAAATVLIGAIMSKAGVVSFPVYYMVGFWAGTMTTMAFFAVAEDLEK